MGYNPNYKWINPTYPIYNWGYIPLTKWDEPPSSPAVNLGMGLDLLVLQGELIVAMDQLGAQPRSRAGSARATSGGGGYLWKLWKWLDAGLHLMSSCNERCLIPWIPSGYVKIAMENGHRNSGFSYEKW